MHWEFMAILLLLSIPLNNNIVFFLKLDKYILCSDNIEIIVKPKSCPNLLYTPMK